MKIELGKFFGGSDRLGFYIEKIKKIPRNLGRNAFWFILMFILLDILVGEILFYKYVVLKNSEDPEIINISTKFKENTYQSVLKRVQDKEDVLRNVQRVEYQYPFK